VITPRHGDLDQNMKKRNTITDSSDFNTIDQGSLQTAGSKDQSSENTNRKSTKSQKIIMSNKNSDDKKKK